jgi:predicted RNA-binding Zn-ribbon protein involved in translation (DUF1610 family)
MKFICPRCGGDAFHLHKLPEHDSMAQCIACGKAIVFEQSTPKAMAADAVTPSTPSPEASGQPESAKRSKLHLPDRT